MALAASACADPPLQPQPELVVVSGLVTRADGSVVAHRTVEGRCWLDNPEHTTYRSANTDANGRYRLDLSPGLFFLIPVQAPPPDTIRCRIQVFYGADMPFAHRYIETPWPADGAPTVHLSLDLPQGTFEPPP